MDVENLYRQLSNKLFETFYVDDLKYGRQQNDGSYKLIKGKITPVTIEDMLKNQKSLLTYQELHVVDTALIKWVCIDLDIIKSEIVNNEVNDDNLKSVQKTAIAISDFLDSKQIPHLIEFSGRRGFHIWIIFDRLISKADGYNLVNYIFSNVKDSFDKIIAADKFPKTPMVNKNSKGIGLGIKLPLSQNKVNSKLSFFINKEDHFELDQSKWLEEPTTAFLSKQFKILSGLNLVTYGQVEPFIQEYSSTKSYQIFDNFLKNKKIVSGLSNDIKLENILNSLKKCDHLHNMLDDFEKGLGNKERGVLVGLLGQLKTQDNQNLGRDLLIQLFSKIKGYNEEITLKKIDTLKYFQPITCKNLGRCSACNDCSLNSPVELIEGLTLESIPKYAIENIDENLFIKIKKALYQYSYKNDEVPLFTQLEGINSIEIHEIKKQITNIYNGNYNLNLEKYEFERNEITKTRQLFNIDPVNNFISVYFTFILNTIYFSEISNNSYGYEFSNSFYKYNIFNNWFVNWAKYTRKIEDILFGPEYGDYYLIKLDIKSFYDKVDINRLKVKLFEETPYNIKSKLEELSKDDINKYKQIIDYLINLSVQTTGNNSIGLPQGPAYARYLAELYLLGFDKLIEDKFITDQKREFYNRFVDDVFIFVESEDRATDLFAKIKEWLSINNLEFNKEKTKIVNVKEYAESGEYNKFKDNVKYNINFANKNKTTLSETEIQEAISKLESLTYDSKFGLKDNLRFFYSQFNNDKRLNAIRKKLSKKLPFTNDGRGTLYYMFYSNLFENFPDDFWNLVNEIDNVKGLSLSHYINTVLLYHDKHKSKFKEIDNLLHKVHLRDDLSQADQLLIASLAFMTNNPINLNYPKKIIYSAIQTPNMELTIQHWELIQNKLRDTDKAELLNELERIIISQNHSKAFLNELANYAFIRFSEWKNDSTAFLLNEDILGTYYQILSFLTLFENSNSNLSVTAAWKLLLDKSVELGEITNKKHQFLWIDKVDKFKYDDFSNNSYSIILTNKPGAILSEINCKNEFLKQFRNLLIVLLFDKDKINDLKHFQADVLSLIQDTQDSLFFTWIGDKNAILYPESDEICLKNIALNGLIVLKNNNKIFVKNVYDNIETEKFDYLKIDTSYAQKAEIEYEIPAENLSLQLNSDNFYQFIKNLSTILERHSEFSKKYNVANPVFYNPFNSIDQFPIIPFYSIYSEVIDAYGNIVKINDSGYWQTINDLISKVEHKDSIKLTADNSAFNFDISELEERFYPKSGTIPFSIESRIDFIKAFTANINTAQFDIFQYQYVWSITMFKIAAKLSNGLNTITNYLQIHFQNYIDKDSEFDLFFSVDQNLLIQDNTLFDFYKTILDSVNIFQNQVVLSDIDFVEILNDFIIADLTIYNDQDEDSKTIASHKLNKMNIDIKDEFNAIQKTSSLKLYIDGIEKNYFEKFYLFNHSSKRFESEDLSGLVEKMKSTTHYTFSTEKSIFIYTPEKELVKCLERITKRKELYEEIHINQTAEHANRISQLKSLFPENKNYTAIINIINNFDSITTLKDKLRFHYKNGFDISDRLTNWFSIFNKDSIKDSELEKYMLKESLQLPYLYNTILKVLSKHIHISNEHVDSFRDKVKSVSYAKNTVVIPIKNPLNDGNGLKRLLEKCGYEDRDFDWQKNFYSLCTDKSAVKKIIVLTDVAISGSQTKKAFDYYMTEQNDNDALINFNKNKIGDSKSPMDERYFLYGDINESANFQNNIRNCEQIIFVSSIMTETFEINVKKYFDEINPNVTFEKFGRAIKANEYLYGDTGLNHDQKDLFNVLLNDVELISKLFYIDGKYKKNIENKDGLNLILRVGSLPAKHIKLFSLQPRKGQPLLDYTYNWK